MSVNRDRYPIWLLAFGLALAAGHSSASPSQTTGGPMRAKAVVGNTALVTDATSDRKTAEAVPNSLPIPPRTAPPSRQQVNATIEHFARKYRLDLDLVHALINAESAYDAHAVSRAGAVGLMQVMPATGADYGVTSVDALFDPATNLHTGMRHLRRLLDKYDSIGQAVMAYNAGEGALERGGGFVAYPETQRYTHAVLVSYLRKKGVLPYSVQARQVLGMDVTPEMAQASGAKKKSGRGAADSKTGSADEAPRRAPATRLKSRLSPGLSHESEGGVSAPASRPISHGVLDRNLSRFSVGGR